MDARFTASRTALLATALAVVLVACDESPSTTRPSWQLDPARFPVVLERPVNVVAQADGSGVREPPPAPEPPPEDGGVASPDGRRRAIVRDGKLLLKEGDAAPVAVVPAERWFEFTGMEWSPDSRQLLFSAASAHRRFAVYVVNADGSGLTMVSGEMGVAVSDPGWSPDGKLIGLIRSDGAECPSGANRIYVVRADGTGARLAGTYNFACGDAVHDPPTWSPDGRWIAVVSAGTEDEPAGTSVFDAWGGPMMKLGGGGQFSWSPDGRFIAYGELDWTTSRIVVVDLAAPEVPRFLTEGFWPRWSPSGDRIAYKRAQNPTHVSTIRPDGTGLTVVADDGEYATSEITWLADGERLELVRGPLTGQRFNAVDLRDGSRRRSSSAFGTAPNIDLSPDRQRIAFSGEAGVLFTLDIETDELTALTPPGYAGHVDWSPDGRVLALGTMSALYTVNDDGSSFLKISEDDAGGPIWSPDGTRIAFVRFAQQLSVVVVNADGGGRQEFPAGGSVGDVAWSPDSESVIFGTADANGVLRGSIADVVHGELRQLSDDDRTRLASSRSPDGRLAARLGGTEKSVALWISDVDGGHERRLAAFDTLEDECCLSPDWSPAWSPDGARIAVTFSPAGPLHGVHIVDVATGVSTLAATTEANCTLSFVGWAADSRVIYVVPECGLGGP